MLALKIISTIILSLYSLCMALTGAKFRAEKQDKHMWMCVFVIISFTVLALTIWVA